jgi:hypothetical protein
MTRTVQKEGGRGGLFVRYRVTCPTWPLSTVLVVWQGLCLLVSRQGGPARVSDVLVRRMYVFEPLQHPVFSAERCLSLAPNFLFARSIMCLSYIFIVLQQLPRSNGARSRTQIPRMYNCPVLSPHHRTEETVGHRDLLGSWARRGRPFGPSAGTMSGRTYIQYSVKVLVSQDRHLVCSRWSARCSS